MIEEEIKFQARDGYPLRGLLLRPAGTPKAGILFNGGTGFNYRFYRSFAEDAVERGFLCLLYDPRGIGVSVPDDLGAMEMDYTDWGRHDSPAAVDRLAEEVLGRPVLHVGHSVGGHFVGLWDNHAKVKAHAFVCVGSGYWAHHALSSRLGELYFWCVYGPYSLMRHGYVAKGGGWTGEALPRGVFKTWRRWCFKSRYFTDEIKRGEGHFAGHLYKDVRAKICTWIYSDDPIANPITAPVILDLYENAEQEIALRAPKDYGLAAIGHNGPFSSSKAPARVEILEWLDAQV